MATNARQFTAASNHKITCSLGSVAAFGPATFLAMVKLDDITAHKDIFAPGNSDPNAWTFYITNTEAVGYWNGNAGHERLSSTGVVTSGVWYLVAVTKTTGTTTPRFHIYDYGTPGWVHADTAGGTSANGTTPTGSLYIGINNGGAGNPWNGAIQAMAFWNSSLSDGALEALVDTRQSWLDASPAAMWTLNQGDVGTALTDDIGSADQTAITGTTVTTGNPDWDDGIAYGAPLGTTADAGSTNPYTLTTTGAVPSGGLVIVATALGATTTPPVGTLTGTLSWSKLDPPLTGVDGSNNWALDLWYAMAPSGLASSTVLSLAWTGGTPYSGLLSAFYVTGYTSPVVDMVDGQVRTSPNSSWDSTASATTVNDTILIGAAFADHANLTMTSSATGSATEIHDFFSTDAIYLTTTYRVVASTASYGATGTWSQTPSATDGALIAAFAEGTAAQTARPDADTTTTGWTTTPLYSKLADESDATVVTATLA